MGRAKTKKGARKKGGLARTIAREVSDKHERIALAARADIALIHRRRARIAEDFYEVGEALVRLKAPGVAAALGYPSFAALCGAELGLSATKAAQLVDIVRGATRDDAIAFGQERVAALLALADATPEVDTATSLARAKIALPSGKLLEVGRATTSAIWSGAAELRAARPASKRGRGLTTTPEERREASTLEAVLHHHGLAAARVKAVAKGKAGAHVRIEGVPLASLATLAEACVELAKPRRRKR
jgi:hypothetical protein